MRLSKQETLKLCQQPAKSRGKRYCGNGDIMALVCQVISQKHMIKGLLDFMGGSPLWQVTTLPSLVVIGCCNKLLYDLARARDSITIRLYRQESLKVSHHTTKFVCDRHCGSGNKMSQFCHMILQNLVIRRSCDFMGRSPSR